MDQKKFYKIVECQESDINPKKDLFFVAFPHGKSKEAFEWSKNLEMRELVVPESEITSTRGILMGFHFDQVFDLAFPPEPPAPKPEYCPQCAYVHLKASGCVRPDHEAFIEATQPLFSPPQVPAAPSEDLKPTQMPPEK